MRILNLKKPSEKKDWNYVELNASHFDELIDEDVRVLDHSGKVVFVFLKRALSMTAVTQAWRAIEDWWPQTNLRRRVQGSKQEFHYKDGKKTNYRIGFKNCYSGVMGYMTRFPTMPCCRPCGFNTHEPERFAQFFPISQEIAALHKQHDPQSWAVYEDFANRVHKDWKIGGTPYNTITMNKNFQTWPHKDGINLPATCPMTVIRKGKYRGGNLVFPDHRIAVNIDTSDLILFMNSQEWHGNTQITGMTEGHVRASFIWYCQKKMYECGSADEEVVRAQTMREKL